jgi:hypothetical protein
MRMGVQIRRRKRREYANADVYAGKEAEVEQDPVPERSKAVLSGETPLDTI